MQSGVYNYFLNGKHTGVTETFDIKILPDGSKQTTSIRDAKPFNTIIKVETSEQNGAFETCKIVYRKDENEVEAIYEFSETRLKIRRKIEGEIIRDETFDLPHNYVFFPLMRYFQGQTILQISQNQNTSTVIVPDIQPTTDFKNLLRSTFDERTGKLISTKDNLYVYSYLSKHYDDNSEFYINENGLLVYYKFALNETQIWEVKL
jgi:hypothetical protein